MWNWTIIWSNINIQLGVTKENRFWPSHSWFWLRFHVQEEAYIWKCILFYICHSKFSNSSLPSSKRHGRNMAFRWWRVSNAFLCLCAQPMSMIDNKEDVPRLAAEYLRLFAIGNLLSTPFSRWRFRIIWLEAVRRAAYRKVGATNQAEYDAVIRGQYGIKVELDATDLEAVVPQLLLDFWGSSWCI